MEMEPQTVPTASRWNRKKIVLVILAALITVLILIVGIAHFFYQPLRLETDSPSGPLDTIKNEEAAVPEASRVSPDALPFGDKSILLARENEAQDPRPSNPANLVREYSIAAYVPEHDDEGEIAVIKNNFFVESFGYADSALYFINPHGELASIDLITNREETLKLEGITPTDDYLNDRTLYNFTLSGEKIFYLQGVCSEGGYCALGVYDLATGKNRIVIDNLQTKVGGSIFYVYKLLSYDRERNVLNFRNSAGDAGWAAASIYEIDLDDDSITKTAAESYSSCQDSECTPELKATNEAYEKLFAKAQTACGDVTVTYAYHDVTLSGTREKAFKKYNYVGCVED